jgi:hypothetical protein
MRLFKDGRGLLRRVRWFRVTLVAAAIGAIGWWTPPRADDEQAAISAFKTIDASQSLWRDDDAALDYGTLDDLSNTTLIDGVIGQGVRQGYVFTPADVLPLGK